MSVHVSYGYVAAALALSLPHPWPPIISVHKSEMFHDLLDNGGVESSNHSCYMVSTLFLFTYMKGIQEALIYTYVLGA